MSFRAVFSGAVIVAALCCACGGRINEVTLTKSLTSIGPEWTEMALPNSAVAKWDAQIVYATLDSGAKPAYQPFGLKSKDGTFFKPELDLISDRGINYALRLGGFRQGDNIEVIFDANSVPKGTHLVRLRMRSSKPVTLGPISWFSFMPQDTKTGEP
ncbi:MAG TPA: hypothetical protein VFW94_21490 [Candidatus Acidoferrales bacterium]|nr:hypothetical protein [Candidatus Acidoferrales bacterium]